jgi:single-strand DNA-binding protein
MSRDTNLTIKSGRLTANPQLRYSPEGKAKCEFSIACNSSDTKVNFFNCVAWEKGAEIINEYMKKGSKILVIGRDEQNRWDDDQGKKQVRSTIQVKEFEFMGGKRDEE